MFIGFPLVFFVCSVACSSVDKAPLTPGEESQEAAIKVLKDAIAVFASDPISTSKGKLTMSVPSSSPTHEVLSKVLRKFPTLNGYKKANAAHLITELGSQGYCSSLFDHAHTNVKFTLLSILEKCSPGDYDNLRSWEAILDAVRRVFEEHAPPEVSKKLISKNNDAFSFLLFFLVHFKLNYNEVSKVVPTKSAATEENNRGLKRKASPTSKNSNVEKRRRVDASRQNDEEPNGALSSSLASAPISLISKISEFSPSTFSRQQLVNGTNVSPQLMPNPFALTPSSLSILSYEKMWINAAPQFLDRNTIPTMPESNVVTLTLPQRTTPSLENPELVGSSEDIILDGFEFLNAVQHTDGDNQEEAQDIEDIEEYEPASNGNNGYSDDIFWG